MRIDVIGEDGPGRGDPVSEDAERLHGRARDLITMSRGDGLADLAIWDDLSCSGVAVEEYGQPSSNIDDAAALMPAHWFVRVEKNSHNWWVCHARERGYDEPWAHGAVAATEPLARAACALLVRAALLRRS